MSYDSLKKLYGMEFLDNFHEYPGGMYGLVRYYHRKKARIATKFINENSNKNKTFLDAGCGRGPYTYLAKSHFKTVYAFEYDQGELDIAKKNNEDNDSNVVYKQVDLTNIPLEDNTVDFIVCSEVFEHIPNYQKASDECYRVLKKGGKMLLSMPNGSSLFYKIAKFKHEKKMDLTKFHEWETARHWSFSYKDIENIAKTSGFKIIKRDGTTIVPIPHGVKGFMMGKIPFIFNVTEKFDNFLAHNIPVFSVNYFLTLEK